MRGPFYILVSLAALALLIESFFTFSYWVFPEFYLKTLLKRQAAVTAAVSEQLSPDGSDEGTQRVYASDRGRRVSAELVKVIADQDMKVAIIRTTGKYTSSKRLTVSYTYASGYRRTAEGYQALLRYCERGEGGCSFDILRADAPGPSARMQESEGEPQISNVLLYGAGISEQTLVFDKRVRIFWLTDSPMQEEGLLIAYSDADTSGDGELTVIDQQKLAKFSLVDASLTEYRLPGSLVSIGPGRAPTSSLHLAYRIDVNDDGRFDTDLDTDRVAVLDLETGAITEQVDEDILEQAQKIVDGTAQ